MQDTKDLREFICDIGRRAWQKGMGAANDGNISILLDDNTVLCTPTGVSKGFMTPDMICRIDRAGNSVDGGAWKPSTETKMHLCVYDNRPDACAVVHAHPLYATVHAICGKPITQQIMPESTMSSARCRSRPMRCLRRRICQRRLRPISKDTTPSCWKTMGR